MQRPLSLHLCCPHILLLLCFLGLCGPHLDTALHGCQEASLWGMEGQWLDNSLPHRQLQWQRALWGRGDEGNVTDYSDGLNNGSSPFGFFVAVSWKTYFARSAFSCQGPSKITLYVFAQTNSRSLRLVARYYQWINKLFNPPIHMSKHKTNGHFAKHMKYCFSTYSSNTWFILLFPGVPK